MNFVSAYFYQLLSDISVYYCLLFLLIIISINMEINRTRNLQYQASVIIFMANFHQVKVNNFSCFGDKIWTLRNDPKRQFCVDIKID